MERKGVHLNVACGKVYLYKPRGNSLVEKYKDCLNYTVFRLLNTGEEIKVYKSDASKKLIRIKLTRKIMVENFKVHTTKECRKSFLYGDGSFYKIERDKDSIFFYEIKGDDVFYIIPFTKMFYSMKKTFVEYVDDLQEIIPYYY